MNGKELFESLLDYMENKVKLCEGTNGYCTPCTHKNECSIYQYYCKDKIK